MMVPLVRPRCQSLVEAVGVSTEPEDADLPGRSLWKLAASGDQPRTVFAECHATFSPSAIFMLRDERYKYLYYVGYPPQLFDLIDDPSETTDLASNSGYASLVATYERELSHMIDPERIDRRAQVDQIGRVQAAGGIDAVVAHGAGFHGTPTPTAYAAAKER